ncbi:lipoprotein [Geomonas sp. Red276]
MVHNQIVRYNQLLSEGYKKGDVTRLQEVADPDQAQKVYYHMAALGEGKTRMVSELKKITFVETDLSTPSKARVATREVWDFAFVDFQSGKMKNAVKDYLYQVRYQLENRDGNWIITAISATGEDRKEVPSWNQILNKR